MPRILLWTTYILDSPFLIRIKLFSLHFPLKKKKKNTVHYNDRNKLINY